ncbi:hypothetical protein L4D76_24490 [Photobacterium sagamiensis]|uniref:hypothetical protein n=1 Tax=Photobacterium sagamiensis TaxID=2910241 RepID=UPI003D0EF578
MNRSIIMVTQDDLLAILKGDLAFTLDEAEAFSTALEYIEDDTGEWYALNADRLQSVPFLPFDAGLLTKQKALLGWFGFWVCAFNGSDNDSALEHQSLGAIRALFFVSAASDFIIPNAITTWWHETQAIHRCQKLELCA